MIKNFIYLDEAKLYSFSSQLFEGVTEYVLNEEQLDESNEKASSRVIADVIRETSKFTEKKFLHDHSFNLFEKELESSKQLLDLNHKKYSYMEICDSGKSFVKIEAQGNFLDLRELQYFFGNFNNISDAIATLPFTSDYQELEANQQVSGKSHDNKRRKSELDKLVRQRKSELMGLPQSSIKSFNTILEHFGDDIVRLKQEYSDTTFTSCLNSNYLRDTLTAIYRKYSRNTSKKFVVIGVISQCEPPPDPELDNVAEGSSIFAHFENMGEHLYNLEKTFNGIKNNEIIIEPIAIYTEL